MSDGKDIGTGFDGDDERTQVVTGASSIGPAPATSAAPAPSSAPLPDDGATIIAGSGMFAPSGAGRAPPSTGSGEAHEAGLLPIGSRVAEFEITRVVGQGGFGVVYEAWDHTLERVVAIKEYLPTALSTRQADGSVVPLSERHRETFDLGMRSFINEARLLAQFDHASLLKVYRFWQERGTTYMVMPFYRGDTLRQALAAIPGGVDEAWLMRIMDGVTQALAVMHHANCYHRDIAPDNIILLEGSGRPVVLDFGAARRVITDKTQAITVILKPGYAPIEQYAEMPDMVQGAWTDVYALAAVMHVAVCGRAPPPSVARLLSDSYVPLSGNEILRQRYSPQLLAAIDAGLGVRPDARPQSMGELRAMLGLDGEQTLAPTRPAVTQGGRGAGGGPVTAQRTSAPAGRTVGNTAATATGVANHDHKPSRRMPLVAAAVAVLVLAGGAGWWWMGRGAADGAVASGAPAGAPVQAAQDGGTPSAGSGAAATSAAAPTPPPPPAPRTPADSLQALVDGATPGFGVTATPRKPEVAIGKDRLAFEVRSQREGYVYVYLLSSGGEMFLLFPNLLDKYNKIAANSTLALPRASWPMDAGGPAGSNRFVVMVSEHERDFGASGVQNDGVFPQFPLPVLAALEATRGTGPTPLAGRPNCPGGTACKDVYGAANFKIVEK
ncbi:MAG: serine/threonine-protein kinase [Pseudomonadota bacterium]